MSEDRCFLCPLPGKLPCTECSRSVLACSQLHLRAHRSTGKDGLQQCNPIRAVFVDGVGRCIVADRDIAPLELIFSDEPVVVGPEPSDMSKINFMCFGCLSPLEEGASVRCLKCNLPLCSGVRARWHA